LPSKRHGLPIDPAVVAANPASNLPPPELSDHDLDAQVPRRVRDTDLLHASVVLNAGPPGRPHNNPKAALARIDDLGVITRKA